MVGGLTKMIKLRGGKRKQGEACLLHDHFLPLDVGLLNTTDKFAPLGSLLVKVIMIFTS